MADAPDSKSGSLGSVGSSPTFGTIVLARIVVWLARMARTYGSHSEKNDSSEEPTKEGRR